LGVEGRGDVALEIDDGVALGLARPMYESARCE
jgi:hypothetical protein